MHKLFPVYTIVCEKGLECFSIGLTKIVARTYNGRKCRTYSGCMEDGCQSRRLNFQWLWTGLKVFMNWTYNSRG